LALPLAAGAVSLIQKETVSIHGAVELVEISNNKSQMTNKYQ
jgi:predicted HTH domain antitoxin